MKLKMIVLAAIVATILLGSASQGAFAKHGGGGGNGGGGKTTLVAPLTGSSDFHSAKGKAKFKAKANETELEVEVEHVRNLAGQSLNVFVNNVQVGSVTVSTLGAANLELNSEAGDSVPAVQGGTTVQVKTTGGVLVASGTF